MDFLVLYFYKIYKIKEKNLIKKKVYSNIKYYKSP